MPQNEALAIYRPRGLGTRLSEAAEKYVEEFVWDPNPDAFVADHVPTEDEKMMMKDMLAGLFADDTFSAILQEAARGMKAGGMDPEGPDSQ